MQAWNLDRKIQVTQTRLLEWYQRWEGKCYVSFSGGKDSTVLAYLAAGVCQTLGYKLTLWFSDTGLEYPELKEHVKSFGDWLKGKYPIEIETIIDYPKDRKTGKRITFKDVILTQGYPVISKTVSNVIRYAKKGEEYRLNRLNGLLTRKDGKSSMFNCSKYKYLLDAPFEVSDACCDIMKKRPSKRFSKETKLVPIIGTMAHESVLRKAQWIKHGCNIFEGKNIASKPISFWTDQDILDFILQYGLPYPSVYGEILRNEEGKLYTTGCDRTGCMFCGFGAHLEKEPNRFQRLKETHPKVWEYCMKPVEEGGLGMRTVLEFIGVKVEKEEKLSEENEVNDNNSN